METLEALIRIVNNPTFWENVSTTLVRGGMSFIIIVSVSTFLGLLSGFFPFMKSFLTPLLVICKATPVMAIILLAFIWFTSGTVPIFSAFLMGFPVMFVQVEEGVHHISKELHEVTKVYKFSRRTRFFHFHIPSMAPYLITGSKSTLSMIWKVIIASEVLTVPTFGVGSKMSLAQVNLETAQVISWTIIAILLTALSDLLFSIFLKETTRYRNRKNFSETRELIW
jgi:NitT/TauT family transport system permease protein